MRLGVRTRVAAAFGVALVVCSATAAASTWPTAQRHAVQARATLVVDRSFEIRTADPHRALWRNRGQVARK